MKPANTPAISPRYWGAILMASVCGTNAGDLYAHDSGLGIAGGLALLAVCAAAIFAIEAKSARQTVLWYWLAIILIRTGATNIADFMAWGLHVPMALLLGGLAALIALGAWLGKTLDTGGRITPASDGGYWLAMLAAGVFGTAAGDFVQHFIGQDNAAIVLGLFLGGALAFTRGRFTGVAAYWLTVALARTAGTAMGDWLAESPRLGLGLPIATMISGALFVIAVAIGAHQQNSGKSSQ